VLTSSLKKKFKISHWNCINGANFLLLYLSTSYNNFAGLKAGAIKKFTSRHRHLKHVSVPYIWNQQTINGKVYFCFCFRMSVSRLSSIDAMKTL